jgi:hypothetical protein
VEATVLRFNSSSQKAGLNALGAPAGSSRHETAFETQNPEVLEIGVESATMQLRSVGGNAAFA